MSPLIVGPLVEAVGGIADDLFTSDEERIRAELEFAQLNANVNIAQIDVNKAQAGHASIFVAGARPATMWVGALALAWAGIVHPMLMWCWALLQAKGWIPMTMLPPPTLDSDLLWVVVTGLLGIGTMRSFEKTRGVATKAVHRAERYAAPPGTDAPRGTMEIEAP